VHVELESGKAAAEAPMTLDLVALDRALHALGRVDARKVQVFELRYFGGLTVDETADILKVSPDTVARDWRAARVWLLRELSAPRSG
jgi:RNA polymerase sigma factor (sigma-70 family)